MIKVLNRALIVAAASGLLLLTAACGGGNKTAICEDATKAFSEYGTAASAGAGNLDAFNKAGTELAATLTKLSGEADGDLKETLSTMAGAWAGVKIDAADPAASATKLVEFAKKATDQSTQLVAACS